jgi:hypothetical protein
LYGLFILSAGILLPAAMELNAPNLSFIEAAEGTPAFLS